MRQKNYPEDKDLAGFKSVSSGKIIASFPGSYAPKRRCREPVFFSRDHDIIEMGPELLEQKDNILHIVQLTMCSTFSVCDICPPIARYV